MTAENANEFYNAHFRKILKNTSTQSETIPEIFHDMLKQISDLTKEKDKMTNQNETFIKELTGVSVMIAEK